MSVNEGVVEAFRDNQDNRILKVHLFDDSINRHGWGIDRELAASLAKEYEAGAPYLIPPRLNHPVRPYPPFLNDPIKDIEDIKRFAAPYKAGECFKTEPCVSNHSQFGYDGYIKLTDPKAIEAFDRGLIPRYSSVAIYDLGGERRAGGLLTKAQALNICAVAIPAYGNAQLLGTCKGDELTCNSNLKNAGTTENNYCILKTLEENNFEKFSSSNTSLNRGNEFVASLDNTMSQVQPQATNNNVNLASTSTSSPTLGTTTGVSTGAPVTPQPGVLVTPAEIQQQQQQPEPSVEEKINKEIDEVIADKKAYDALKAEFDQRGALLTDLQKRVLAFEKAQDALKIKEIERYCTIDLFNGDTKSHSAKVKEWKERAEQMTLDDLSWHLTESYGRKNYVIGEKKAGLQYEPTAVLSANSNAQTPAKKFSIYDMGGAI